MSQLKDEIKNEILDLLNKTTNKVLNATGDDLFDLIESHPKFPHCEKYVVDLISRLNYFIQAKGFSISKGALVAIYLKHKEATNANEKRVNDIILSIR
jgi:hypothetical protein